MNTKAMPALGLILSSAIVSMLLLMNYNKGMVKAFEFMILLSTLTCLVPYLFTAATHILISKREQRNWIIGGIAFLFSIWAVIGCGSEIIIWGMVSLLCGVPMYFWMKRT